MSLRPSPHELARIRADSEQLRIINVALYRPAYSRTSGGGSSMAYALVDQGPGRLAAMSGSTQEAFAEKLAESSGWVISIHPGRDINVDDQLRAEGRTFEVIGTNYGETYSWLQRVPCREILN